MKMRLIIVFTSLLMLMLNSCYGDKSNLQKYQDLQKGTVKRLGHISEFNSNSNSFYYDEVEWLTEKDAERLKKLGVDPENDMPNGFYVYNPNSDKISYNINDKTKYAIINWDNCQLKTISLNEFLTSLKEFPEVSLYWIVINNGVVKSIEEQYRP